MRRICPIVTLVLAISLIIFPPATLANPVAIQRTEIGVSDLLTLAEGVNMSTADVQITISTDGIPITLDGIPNHNYTIVMESEFSISTSFDQNITISFVYPSSWSWSSPFQEDVTLVMNVLLDGLEVTHIITEVDEEEYQEVIPDAPGALSFASINASLYTGHNYTLEVDTMIQKFVGTEEDLRFTYYVGSAKCWSGQPHEVVQITVENSSLFEEIVFFPEDSLDVSSVDSCQTGVWILEFPSCQYYEVGCILLPPSGNVGASVFTVVSVAVPVVLVASLVYFTHYQKKKEKRRNGGPGVI